MSTTANSGLLGQGKTSLAWNIGRAYMMAITAGAWWLGLISLARTFIHHDEGLGLVLASSGMGAAAGAIAVFVEAHWPSRDCPDLALRYLRAEDEFAPWSPVTLVGLVVFLLARSREEERRDDKLF